LEKNKHSEDKMKYLIKRLVLGICILLVSPFIILTRLEEFLGSEEFFRFVGVL